MALVVKDRVQETSTTTGTGTFTLAGAVTGFQSFSAIGDGNTTYYAIVGSAEWEVGLGTYTSSGTTLSRDTILESSNGGTAVNFSAGTKNVFVTYPAEKSLYLDGSNNAIGLGTVSATTTLTNATGLPLTTGVTGTLPVANGGTNQTSYTDGQLLIGNTTGNTLAKATLTAGTGISVTNGAGSITINNSAPSAEWQSVQTSNFTAVSNKAYPINTTSASINATLPASPSAGDTISFVDYAGTFSTNNFIVRPNGNKINSTIAVRSFSNNREAVTFVYIDSTQGWIIANDGYLGTVPFANTTLTVEYLVIAGGGGGGSSFGGGGGAGGYRTASGFSVTQSTNYTVTVGAGGAAVTSGNNSVFSTITSTGGGSGGTGNNGSGVTGGSGGGGAGNNFLTIDAVQSNWGNGTASQGNRGGGGSRTSLTDRGGGGGGAGAVGGNNDGTSTGGAGGAGLASSITGSSVTRAGGGGAQGGAGGAGGGGAGGGGAGTANTGGGGGGHQGGTGGTGGSGIVIIKYPDVFTISNPGGGLTYSTSTSSGFSVTTFTAGTGNISWG